MPRQVQFASNTSIATCPKCGNNTRFRACSDQIGEDLCETWVECRCGYDPTAMKHWYRFENVWGGTSKEYVSAAIGVWNDMIRQQQPA